MSNVLTRNQRLNELNHLLKGGNQLLYAASNRGGLGRSFPEILKDAEAWRAKAISTLSTIDATQKWFTWPDQQELSAISIDQAINGIQILNWRIEDERPEILSDEDADKINIATRLLAFGSYIINYATKNIRGIPFTDLNAFKPFQNEHLPMSLEKAQRWASQAKHKSDEWMKSLDFIKKHFDNGSNIFLLDKPLNWHFGWALFTLGWQLTESLGDSISMNDLRCCSFEQCKAARREYNESRCITCPRCEGDVDYQQIPGDYLGETGPFSGFWHCESCSHAGYFPLNAHPDSAWHISRGQRRSAQQVVSIIVNQLDSESKLLARPNVDVIILTAITLEYRAVLQVNAGAWDETDWDARKTAEGLPLAFRTFRGKGGRPLRLALAQAGDMGMLAATTALLPLVHEYSPRCIAMTGVCAGRPGKTNLGDVIAADRLFFHDTGKQLPDVVQQDLRTYNLRDDWKVAIEHFDFAAHFRNDGWWQRRPIPYEWQENWVLAKLRDGIADPSSLPECQEFCPQWSRVIEGLWKTGDLQDAKLALAEKGHTRIQRILIKHRNRLPNLTPGGAELPFRVHVAPMGSGNKVIEDTDVWSFVSEHMRKTLGLEMEAAALGALAHTQRSRRIDALVMKGVMDFANDGRDDHFKEYAARASAECLVAFLREHLDADAERIEHLNKSRGDNAPAAVGELNISGNVKGSSIVVGSGNSVSVGEKPGQ